MSKISDQKNTSQRALNTKGLIHNALLDLLRTKKINKISISELCKLAGINRTTFYNHYGSQYEVLNEIAQNFLKSTSFAVMNDLKDGKNIHDCMVQVLYYIREHVDFAKLMLDQEHYDLLTHIQFSLPTFDQMVINSLSPQLTKDEKEAITSYVQYGTVQFLIEWIRSDCARTPEEQTELLFWVIARIIGQS